MSKSLGRAVFVGLIWVFALRYYLECLGLSQRSEKLTINLAFWLMTVFTIWEMVGVVKSTLREKRENGLFTDSLFRKTIRDNRTQLILAVVLYIILIPLVGFYATSFVAFCAFSFILGSRNPLRMVLGGGFMMILIYGIFTVLLQLRLPAGLLM